MSQVALCFTLTGVTSSSDVYAVVAKQGAKILGATEKQSAKSDTIEFATPVPFEYHFEIIQQLQFEVLNNDVSLEKVVNVRMSQIVGSEGSQTSLKKHIPLNEQGLTLNIAVKNAKTKAKANEDILLFDGDKELQEARNKYRQVSTTLKGIPAKRPVKEYVLKLKCRAKGVDNKDGPLGVSDPYYAVFYKNENKYTSKTIMDNADPVWEEWTVNTTELCKSDPDAVLRIDVTDWNKLTSHKFIGSFEVTLGELVNAKSHSFNLFSKHKAEKSAKKNKPYNSSGLFFVEVVEKVEKRELIEPNPLYTKTEQEANKAKAVLDVQEAKRAKERAAEKLKYKYVYQKIHSPYSFLDYLQGGCEISLIVGIDFTASNYNPSMKNSLHYLHGTELNAYQQVITDVGTILADYDADHLFPAFAFGAQDKVTKQSLSCYSLLGDENSECQGVQGILDAYKQAFDKVELAGPTYYHKIIDKSSTYASNHCTQEHQHYYVLLIITDGEYNDKEETIQSLIHASNLPVSVVIVGVGDVSFHNMHVLDANDHPLHNHDYTDWCVRDIVQCATVKEFAKSNVNACEATHALVRKTMQAIPAQLVKYFYLQGIKPNNLQ